MQLIAFKEEQEYEEEDNEEYNFSGEKESEDEEEELLSEIYIPDIKIEVSFKQVVGIK